jgi:hypothetical protein
MKMTDLEWTELSCDQLAWSEQLKSILQNYDNSKFVNKLSKFGNAGLKSEIYYLKKKK